VREKWLGGFLGCGWGVGFCGVLVCFGVFGF